MRVSIVVALTALSLAGAAFGSSQTSLSRQETALARKVEKAKSTIRFFASHPQLFRSKDPRVRRRARLDANSARVVFIKGRARLAEIRVSLRRLRVSAVGDRAAWLCIHRYEGSWTDSGDPYWGGLQMDREFMADYGADMVRKYGGAIIGPPRHRQAIGGEANHWTPEEQMIVAERARKTRGYWPWPNTARYCHLI